MTHASHLRPRLGIGLFMLALFSCGGQHDVAMPRRVATWASAQQDYNELLPGALPLRGPLTLTHVTVRQIAHLSLGGTDVRIKLSNLFGTTPTTFSAISAALSVGGSTIDPATAHAVTFAGAPELTLAAGAEAWSDPIAWPVVDHADLAVSFYLPTDAAVGSVHLIAQQSQYIAAGNAVTATTLDGAEVTTSTYWLAAVDVVADAQAKVVVAFGDSLTDGVESTVDANRRWPNDLDTRLHAQPAATPISVVNTGIGGNRWLNDFIGPNGSGRFAREVLAASGVTHTVIWLGINDIGVPVYVPAQVVTAEQITAAIANAASAAQDHGVRVCVATLTPFSGAFYYTDENEAKRQAVNAWIRGNSSFSVVDFDLAARDPANPTALLPAFDSGDHLHLTDLGYQHLADTLDLGFFAP